MRAPLTLTLVLLFAAPALALPALPYDHDDAGSGADAGDRPEGALPVDAGVAYEGAIAGTAFGDEWDFYTFDATAGDVIDFQLASTSVCAYLFFGDGQGLGHIASTCSHAEASLMWLEWEAPHFTLGTDPGFTVTAPETGTYDVAIGWWEPAQYAFSFALDGEAPDVDTFDVVS